MTETFDILKETIVRVTKLDPSRVQPESHVLVDLEIDSLDFLDIMMTIEDKFEIDLPLPKADSPREVFILANISEKIDALVSSGAKRTRDKKDT